VYASYPLRSPKAELIKQLLTLFRKELPVAHRPR
jgi:hypothetical protein